MFSLKKKKKKTHPQQIPSFPKRGAEKLVWLSPGLGPEDGEVQVLWPMTKPACQLYPHSLNFLSAQCFHGPCIGATEALATDLCLARDRQKGQMLRRMSQVKDIESSRTLLSCICLWAKDALWWAARWAGRTLCSKAPYVVLPPPVTLYRCIV